VTDDISLATHDALAAAWRSLRRATGLRLREVACVGAPRTLLFGEIGGHDQPVVTISAAVHGDEPAGAWALYALVRDGLLDPRFAYRLWPCLNPTGFDARTRANAEGADVNRSFGGGGRTPEAKAVRTADRDRRFALTIDLHEDHEADAFYLYETALPPWPSRYARPVTRAIVEAGWPLQAFGPGFELGPPGSETAQVRAPGAVLVDAAAEAPFYGRDLPQGLVTVRGATPCALTFETPLCLPPAVRVAMHRVAVVNAIAAATAALV
jgi:hypothetical protein